MSVVIYPCRRRPPPPASVPAGLEPAVNDPTVQLTIFAPSDAALAKYLGDAGITDPAVIPASQLRQLLSHHVLPSPLKAATLLSTQSSPLTTLLSSAPAGCSATLSVERAGAFVTVKAGGSSATVTSVDVPACLVGDSFQSVVHIIDGVLLPCPTASSPHRRPSRPPAMQCAAPHPATWRSSCCATRRSATGWTLASASRWRRHRQPSHGRPSASTCARLAPVGVFHCGLLLLFLPQLIACCCYPSLGLNFSLIAGLPVPGSGDDSRASPVSSAFAAAAGDCR